MKAMGSFGVEKKIDKIVKLISERYMPLLNFAAIDNPTLLVELVLAAMEGISLEAGFLGKNPQMMNLSAGEM